MKEFSRTQRMGDQIQRELAQLIQQQVSDPRVGMVTVSAVKLSKDLAHAKIFITVLDDKQDPASSIKILNGAVGFLRHELARRTLMRVIPRLRFIYDPTVEHGANLSALINAAVRSDQGHDKE
jgi:ribosome-binding factor A